MIRNAKIKGCSLCDEKDPCALDLHHIDQATKCFTVGEALFDQTCSAAQLLEEIEKCVVVCANCHRKHHAGLTACDQPVDNDRDLIDVPASELRLLSPSAQAMARVLIRERERQEPEDGWFLSDLSELARRARIAYGTAKAALAELRKAGLLACERHVVQRKIWVESAGGRAGYDLVNAYERNWYAISGYIRKRAGLQVMALDRVSWQAFLAARTRSKRKLVRLAAHRPAWPKQIEWQASWTAELMGRLVTPSPCDVLGLSTKSSTSVFSQSNKKNKEASEKARGRISSSVGGGSIPEDDDWFMDVIMEPEPDLNDPNYDPSSGSPIACNGTGQGGDPRRNPLYEGPWSPPYMLPDRNEKEPAQIQWLSPDMVPEQKATYVVDAYRRAVKKIYGIDWFHYFKGDIKKAKHFDKLLAAGKAFAEHSIPPQHWAIWRLEWFSKNVKAFALKPPPVWMIMSASKVSEKAGWFRKDYDLPLPTFKLDPMIHEQHLRNQEACNRWMNFEYPLLYMPRPYVEKRQREIERGLIDPHDNWPRRSFWSYR